MRADTTELSWTESYLFDGSNGFIFRIGVKRFERSRASQAFFPFFIRKDNISIRQFLDSLLFNLTYRSTLVDW